MTYLSGGSGIAHHTLRGCMSYDDKQINARLVTWLCCRQAVFATAPEKGCIACR